MATWKIFWITLVFVAIHFHEITWAANVALFKPITASATCGLSGVEDYFSVRERNKPLRQRIVSYCDASNASRSHNASQMVDGNLATWWQAPNSIDNVSITIDLRGEHQKVSVRSCDPVKYSFCKMQLLKPSFDFIALRKQFFFLSVGLLRCCYLNEL